MLADGAGGMSSGSELKRVTFALQLYLSSLNRQAVEDLRDGGRWSGKLVRGGTGRSGRN